MSAHKTKIFRMGAVLFCLAVFCSGLSAASEQKVVKLGIWPCTSPMKVYRQYQELAGFLSTETGLKVKLVIPKNSAAFFELVKRDGVDFAFQDANVYSRLAGNYSPGHLLQALTAEGKSVERGVIIVRKDSGITDVKALKGKKILFGDEQSLTKHITIKKLLAENGLDVKKDLAGYSFGRDCEGIILRVYLRKTDAGAIDNWSWKALHEPGEQEVEADQLTEIAEGAAVPYWVFSVHKDTDESIAAKFEQALLKLDNKNAAYKEILKNMEIGGFVKSKETDYGILQDLR